MLLLSVSGHINCAYECPPTGANKENETSGLIRFPLFSNEKLGLFWQNQWGFCPIRSQAQP
jgi:hypothetical protein